MNVGSVPMFVGPNNNPIPCGLSINISFNCIIVSYLKKLEFHFAFGNAIPSNSKLYSVNFNINRLYALLLLMSN